jgi:hypothetical protein
MTLLAALVLDYGSDVPYAHFERQRVLLVHAAEGHGGFRRAPAHQAGVCVPRISSAAVTCGVALLAVRS